MPDIITIGTLIITVTPPEGPVKVLTPIGLPGVAGDHGWSPILVIATRVSDDAKVLKIQDWTGGLGTKPPGTIGKYVGLAGLVTDIADAVNVRGNATDGQDGATIHLGVGVPDVGLGNVGDLYIDLATYTLYDNRLVGGWTSDGSFEGTPGTNGVNGLSLRSGIGAPGGGLGVNGETYIDLAIFDIYSKAAGAWSLIGNFKGTDGQDGASLLTGSDDPTGAVGTDGDSYVQLTTKHFWTRAAGAWTDQGSLRGADGVIGYTIRGDDGDDGDRGPPGPPGIGTQGPAGSPGLQTILRMDGNDGEDGDRGPPGLASTVPGPAGAPGLQTMMIFQGDDGEDGGIGPPGPISTIPGPSGAPGLQTILVFQGDDGDDGGVGPPGAVSTVPGPAGAPGLQTILRMDGNDGEDGERGPPGLAIVGPAGAPGLQTMMIFQADDGEDGPPGIGLPGLPGAAGASNLVSSKIGFAADKVAFGSQAVTAQTLTKVTFGNEVFDFGAFYDAANSKWTPPAGLVIIAAGLGFSGGPYNSATAVIEIRKNGTAIHTERQTDSAFTGLNSSVSISIVDNANGTDFYEIFGSTPTLSSGSAFFAGDEETFFTGASVQGPTGPAGQTGLILQSIGDDDGEAQSDFPPGHTFNGGLVAGTVDGNNKPAGMIGETISGTFIATAITSGTALELGSITLTPGEWELTGSVQFTPAATTSITRYGGSYSDTSATQDTGVGSGVLFFAAAFVPGNTAANAPTIALPPLILKITAGATKHLVAVATFTVSTMNASGKITARRIG